MIAEIERFAAFLELYNTIFPPLDVFSRSMVCCELSQSSLRAIVCVPRTITRCAEDRSFLENRLGQFLSQIVGE